MLTKKGQKLKAELAQEFYAPPAELLALDRDTLQALVAALAKVAPGADG